jgi:hypothetical protein
VAEEEAEAAEEGRFVAPKNSGKSWYALVCSWFLVWFRKVLFVDLSG